MPTRYSPLAIAYDFDGTLAPGNMQERDFIPKIGMTSKDFWGEVNELCREHEADNILVYMGLMLNKALSAKVSVRKADFEDFGAKLDFFDGVEPSTGGDGEKITGWFGRINEYGKQSGVRVEHYVISSGIREMIAATRIAREFKMIYASSFWYDHNGVAHWPALALNYTTKTQYLFRINKGSPHVYDHTKINRWVPMEDRPVPFANIVFIGDGDTDIPCFRLVKDQGGHSVAVYRPKAKKAKERANDLVEEGRAHFIAPADYRDGKDLDRITKAIIDKISHDAHLRSFGTGPARGSA